MGRKRNADGRRIRNDDGARKHCCCGGPCEFTFAEIGCATFQFNFDGDGTTFLWNFGDGTGRTSTERNPQHTFWGGNSFTVSLTVDGTHTCTEVVSFTCVTDCDRFQAFCSTISSITLETVSTNQSGDCIACINGRTWVCPPFAPGRIPLVNHAYWDGINPVWFSTNNSTATWVYGTRDLQGFNCNGFVYSATQHPAQPQNPAGSGSFRSAGVSLFCNGPTPGIFAAASINSRLPESNKIWLQNCSMTSAMGLQYSDFFLGFSVTSVGNDRIRLTFN